MFHRAEGSDGFLCEVLSANSPHIATVSAGLHFGSLVSSSSSHASKIPGGLRSKEGSLAASSEADKAPQAGTQSVRLAWLAASSMALRIWWGSSEATRSHVAHLCCLKRPGGIDPPLPSPAVSVWVEGN